MTTLEPAHAENREPRSRPFSLLDIMAIVAATAMGLAPAKGSLAAVTVARISNPARMIDLQMVVLPVLIAWSVLGLVLFVCRHGSSLRYLLNRPRFLMCLAALLSTLSVLVTLSLPCQLQYPASSVSNFVNTLTTLSHDTGLLVAGVWVGTVFTTTPRREFDWADRFGRIVGVGWVGLLLQSLCIPTVSYLCK